MRNQGYLQREFIRHTCRCCTWKRNSKDFVGEVLSEGRQLSASSTLAWVSSQAPMSSSSLCSQQPPDDERVIVQRTMLKRVTPTERGTWRESVSHGETNAGTCPANQWDSDQKGSSLSGTDEPRLISSIVADAIRPKMPTVVGLGNTVLKNVLELLDKLGAGKLIKWRFGISINPRIDKKRVGTFCQKFCQFKSGMDESLPARCSNRTHGI